MRLTLPNMSMVITFISPLKNSAGQWNTLVNFESAQLALSGQFYIGVNMPIGYSLRQRCWRHASRRMELKSHGWQTPNPVLR
jgi:hypothetical protein